MRMWILSDLHHELQPEIPLDLPEADVAVLAGDIDSPLSSSVDWAASNIAPHMPVVIIPGNHEYYGDSVSGGIERGLRAASHHSDLHLLVDASVVIGGVRFVGSTLWTDYALDVSDADLRARGSGIAWAMRDAASLLRDHTAIAREDGSPARWMPEDARTMHRWSLAQIESELEHEYEGPTVVVTHYAPHPMSISPRFLSSPLNPAFMSDLSDLILRHQPTAWIHGHVHHSCGYRVGRTQVLCNPRGYGGENSDFDRALVLEV
ncbi:metallophosphoesterase [Microvirga sp. GCM10011540]|uniref:metallophosphoesterase n=1 Tax=Microvirga sp. GCM10011540 TaxID=3317338 RepID=UPI00361EA371